MGDRGIKVFSRSLTSETWKLLDQKRFKLEPRTIAKFFLSILNPSYIRQNRKRKVRKVPGAGTLQGHRKLHL